MNLATLLGIMMFACCGVVMGGDRKIVVAHRGASGYLPEHTLPAKAMAYGMGADYLEQDVVLTRDDQVVVLHDIHLDTVTNVAEVFPSRARPDGRYYAIDFELSEIQQLRVTERIDLETKSAVYPGRFPLWKSDFRVPTLAEEIELIQGLNKSTGRNVGLYTEIKSPAWHRQQGKDISQLVLRILDDYGYRGAGDNAYIQCFDASETQRLRDQLQTKLKLVQLIGENDWNEAPTDFDVLRTPAGLQQLARHADAIGPWMPHVVQGIDDEGKLILTSLVKQAHAAGLQVHPYTLRADALPEYARDFDQLLHIFFEQAEVDGIFTDFPDRAVEFLKQRGRGTARTELRGRELTPRLDTGLIPALESHDPPAQAP